MVIIRSLCALVATASLAGVARAEIAVIVNPKTPVEHADVSDVRKVFLGKEKKIGDASLKPLEVDESSPARVTFLDKVVEKKGTELRQYWSRLVFTGKSTPPRNVGDDAAVKSYVSQNPDAIGIVDASSVDASVKVLLKIR